MRSAVASPAPCITCSAATLDGSRTGTFSYARFVTDDPQSDIAVLVVSGRQLQTTPVRQLSHLARDPVPVAGRSCTLTARRCPLTQPLNRSKRHRDLIRRVMRRREEPRLDRIALANHLGIDRGRCRSISSKSTASPASKIGRWMGAPAAPTCSTTGVADRPVEERTFGSRGRDSGIRTRRCRGPASLRRTATAPPIR